MFPLLQTCFMLQTEFCTYLQICSEILSHWPIFFLTFSWGWGLGNQETKWYKQEQRMYKVGIWTWSLPPTLEKDNDTKTISSHHITHWNVSVDGFPNDNCWTSSRTFLSDKVHRCFEVSASRRSQHALLLSCLGIKRNKKAKQAAHTGHSAFLSMKYLLGILLTCKSLLSTMLN